MTNKEPHSDISVNITAHREGDFLHKTLASIKQAIDYARDRGITSIEVNISLDNSDEQTRKIAESFMGIFDDYHVYENSFGDPSPNRNFLIAVSHGTYIAIYDGDDFFSENYLFEAFTAAAKNSHVPAVYSTGWSISFNEDSPPAEIRRLQSSVDYNFVKTNCYEHNAYLSQLFVHKDVFEHVKYLQKDNIYGYEDWHWNLSVLEAGYDFYTLPDVLFFYRTKRASESTLLQEVSNHATLAPTTFFRPSYFRNLSHRDADAVPIEDFFSRPITQISEESPYVQPIGHAVPKLGKQFAKRLLRDSRLYHIAGLQYRATQQLFAPIVHVARNNHITTNVFPLYRQTFVTLVRGGKPKDVQPNPERLDVDLFKQLFAINVERLESKGFTQLHLDLWRKLNDIEPLIRYSRTTIINMTLVEHNVPSIAKDVYFDFCNKYEGKITDILLIPHLIQGGADNAMIRLVTAMSEAGRKVLVVTTDNRSSAWRFRMERIEGVTFLERYKELERLDDQSFHTLITRIIQNWDISTLTIMNSTLGYRMVDLYGKALVKHVKIYVHTYMFDINDLGMRDFMFQLPRVYDFATRLITDGSTYKNELMRIHGWTSDKISPVYLPINEQVVPCKANELQRRFMFAGRLADQKQIDLLLDLDARFKKLNVKVDLYGARDEVYCRKIRFDERIRNCTNIRYCGAFNNFALDIPLSQYDGMIMPTLNEGMPNVVLEAIKANLFVITGDVGSISEAITTGKNGILVKENTSAEAYLSAMKKFYDKPTLQDHGRRLKLNKTVVERHSAEHYTETILSIYEVGTEQSVYNEVPAKVHKRSRVLG